MGRLNTVQRYEAQALIRIGSSHREVARRFNCHHSTIDRLADRYHETNSVQDQPRSKRPTITNPRQDQHVMLAHAHNRFLTAASTVNNNNKNKNKNYFISEINDVSRSNIIFLS